MSFDLTGGLSIDLRRNTLRGVARKSTGSDLVRANLARSITDASIEGDVLMADARLGIAGINIFDRARSEGVRLIALRGGASLNSVQASDLARARMGMAQNANLLIVPERTPSDSSSHFAWWNLDPSTGNAISTLDTGLNGFQDVPEDAAITQEIDSMAYADTLPEGWGAANDTLLGRRWSIASSSK